MAGVEPKIMQNPPPKESTKPSLATQVCLRLMGAAASLSAALVMFTNKQTVFVYGIQFAAHYNNSSAFMFFAIANVVACVFTVVSLFAAGILARNCSGPDKYFFMFLHDLAMTTLLMAACAAATAIGFVGKFGNSHIGWMAICEDVGIFCDKVIISVTLSFLAFLVHLLLTVISATNQGQGVNPCLMKHFDQYKDKDGPI